VPNIAIASQSSRTSITSGGFGINVPARPSTAFYSNASPPRTGCARHGTGAWDWGHQHRSETLTETLRARLKSRDATPDWMPPADHVLVCGGLSQAVNSALQIRVHTPQVHVVVLCGLMPLRNPALLGEWEEKLAPLLAHDEDAVTLVLGSELESDDLLFAGLSVARTAVIFSPPVMNRSERQTADCQTVLTAMRVRHLAPDVFAIVGMHEGSNARFFRLTRLTNPNQWKTLTSISRKTVALTRQASRCLRASAAGRGGLGQSGRQGVAVNAPETSTSLKDAANRVRAERKVQREKEKVEEDASYEVQAGVRMRDQRGSMVAQDVDFMGGRPQLTQHSMLSAGLKSADLHMSRAFASGHVFTPALLDKLLAESYYNPKIIHVIELLVQGDTHSNKLHTRTIPSRLDGCTFSYLFEMFVRELQLIPVAIYRYSKDSSGFPVIYCYTNPLDRAKVSKDDRVFVIGSSPEKFNDIPKASPTATPWGASQSASVRRSSATHGGDVSPCGVSPCGGYGSGRLPRPKPFVRATSIGDLPEPRMSAAQRQVEEGSSLADSEPYTPPEPQRLLDEMELRNSCVRESRERTESMESYASSLPPYRPSGERRTADLLRASSRKDAPSYRMTTRESGLSLGGLSADGSVKERKASGQSDGSSAAERKWSGGSSGGPDDVLGELRESTFTLGELSGRSMTRTREVSVEESVTPAHIQVTKLRSDGAHGLREAEDADGDDASRTSSLLLPRPNSQMSNDGESASPKQRRSVTFEPVQCPPPINSWDAEPPPPPSPPEGSLSADAVQEPTERPRVISDPRCPRLST